MIKLTPDFLFRQVRIVLFFIGGALVQHGWVGASTVETIVGLGVGAVTWGWSLWGNRLVARINEVVKMDNFVVIGPDEVVEQVASPSAVPASQVTIEGPKDIVKPLDRENPLVQVAPTS